MTLAVQIEALLFASDQPLSLARLVELLPGSSRAEVEAALAELQERCSERAVQPVQLAGGWQLATRPEYVDTVRRLFIGKRRVRLTKAALESLAIIAYKQPTTRPEIDAIRGVASSGVIETLLERNLVRIAGRSEGIGRPLLYATTDEFLRHLGLNRLADLPSLEELEHMLAEREAAARLADEEEMAALAAAARDGEPPAQGDAEAGEVGAEDASLPAAARLEARLRARDLPTLDELDAELDQRSARAQELSQRVAAERARHADEAGEAPRPDRDAASDPSRGSDP
jgi:segregation and condensation protein B